MTLTKADKDSVLKILTGARHTYTTAITNASTDDERSFYQAQLVEAERLIALFRSKRVMEIEEDEEPDEDEDEEEE